MNGKSSQPRKQRKIFYSNPLHKKSKKFTVRLDQLLQEEWGIKRLPLRKDDEVRVIKGEMVDVEGKVLKLRKDGKVELEECTLEKKNGATYYVPIAPSNLILTKLGGKKMDPSREKIINRKQKLLTAAEISATSPKKEGGK